MVLIGRITGSHGIKGHLKLHSFSGNIETLKRAGSVFVKTGPGQPAECFIKTVSRHSTGFIISLRGYENIDDSLTLAGSDLYVRRSDLPQTDENEFYWCDLLGLTVETDEGIHLGAITDIFETGSSDIYVVRGAVKEYLIPAVASVIRSVDIDGKKIVITPLDGLLDL